MTIGGVHRRQITTYARLDILHASFKLGARKIAITMIDSFELAPVNGDQRFRGQVHALAQDNELTAYAADRFAVVFAEPGDGLEVRCEAAREPHQLDIALGLTLK